MTSNVSHFPARPGVGDDFLSKYLECQLDPARRTPENQNQSVSDTELYEHLLKRKALSPIDAAETVRVVGLVTGLINALLPFLDQNKYSFDLFGSYGEDEGWGHQPRFFFMFWPHNSVGSQQPGSETTLAFNAFCFDSFPAAGIVAALREENRPVTQRLFQTPLVECSTLRAVLGTLLEIDYVAGNQTNFDTQHPEFTDRCHLCFYVPVTGPESNGLTLLNFALATRTGHLQLVDNPDVVNGVAELPTLRAGLPKDEFTERRITAAVNSDSGVDYLKLLIQSLSNYHKETK